MGDSYFGITDPGNSLEWMVFLTGKYFGMFLEGTILTLYIAVAGTLLGFVLGYLVGIIQDIRINQGDFFIKKIVVRILKIIASVYVEIFRDDRSGDDNLLWHQTARCKYDSGCCGYTCNNAEYRSIHGRDGKRWNRFH